MESVFLGQGKVDWVEGQAQLRQSIPLRQFNRCLPMGFDPNQLPYAGALLFYYVFHSDFEDNPACYLQMFAM